MRPVPTRAELLAALDDPNHDNPLAVAIGAAMAAYANELEQQTNPARALPNPLVLPMPTTEIEAFALELFTEEMRPRGLRVMLSRPAR